MLIQKQSSEPDVSLVARQALAKLVEFGLPLTPEGFAVWHGYFSGNFPALKQSIDQKLDKGEGIAAADAEALYLLHLSTQPQDAIVETAGRSLDSLMHNMIGQLSSATAHASEYADALNDFQHTLEGENDGTAVAQIIEITNEIQQEQSTLHGTISAAAKSIAGLRKNLKESNHTVSYDELTQVSNWLTIHKELRLQAINSTEKNESLSIAIIDIDAFSNFNDKHGRNIGNSMLCFLASILSDLVKNHGSVGRFGADEFIVVMPGASVNDAAVLTEKFRERVGKQQLRNKKTDEAYGSVTVSGAVSEYEKQEAIAGLVQRTADALDTAKQDGGNKIAFAQREKTMPSSTVLHVMGR